MGGRFGGSISVDGGDGWLDSELEEEVFVIKMKGRVERGNGKRKNVRFGCSTLCTAPDLPHCLLWGQKSG